MKPLRIILPILVLAFAAAAGPSEAQEEHVTNGALDLTWVAGFGQPGNDVPMNLAPQTLAPGHPAYDNPSGDHTVANATTSCAPNCGGIILSATDPGALTDYAWEGWVFVDGTSRRGLAVRCDASTNLSTGYVLVIEPSLIQVRFRKLSAMGATTLGDWFVTPGSIPTNTWRRLRVIAQGSSFRCFLDGAELTTTPILDASYPSGWVGVYNFNQAASNNVAYFDDLALVDGITGTTRPTWGSLKVRYR